MNNETKRRFQDMPLVDLLGMINEVKLNPLFEDKEFLQELENELTYRIKNKELK